MPSANDDFANRVVLTGASGTESFDCTGNTAETNEPTVFSHMGKSGWYEFTAPANGSLNVNTLATTGTVTDTIIAVYLGGPALSDLIFVDYNDDESGPSALSDLTCDVIAGGTYFIQIGTYGGFEEGLIDVDWSFVAVTGYTTPGFPTTAWLNGVRVSEVDPAGSDISFEPRLLDLGGDKALLEYHAYYNNGSAGDVVIWGAVVEAGVPPVVNGPVELYHFDDPNGGTTGQADINYHYGDLIDLGNGRFAVIANLYSYDASFVDTANFTIILGQVSGTTITVLDTYHDTASSASDCWRGARISDDKFLLLKSYDAGGNDAFVVDTSADTVSIGTGYSAPENYFMAGSGVWVGPDGKGFASFYPGTGDNKWCLFTVSGSTVTWDASSITVTDGADTINQSNNGDRIRDGRTSGTFLISGWRSNAGNASLDDDMRLFECHISGSTVVVDAETAAGDYDAFFSGGVSGFYVDTGFSNSDGRYAPRTVTPDGKVVAIHARSAWGTTDMGIFFDYDSLGTRSRVLLNRNDSPNTYAAGPIKWDDTDWMLDVAASDTGAFFAIASEINNGGVYPQVVGVYWVPWNPTGGLLKSKLNDGSLAFWDGRFDPPSSVETGSADAHVGTAGRQLYTFQYGESSVDSYTPADAPHVFLDEASEMTGSGTYLWDTDFDAYTSRWLPNADPTFISETLNSLMYLDFSALDLNSLSKPAGTEWLGFGLHSSSFILFTSLQDINSSNRIRVKLLRIPEGDYTLFVQNSRNTVKWNTSDGQAPPPATLQTYQVMGEWTSGDSPSPGNNPPSQFLTAGHYLKLLDISDPIGCFVFITEDEINGTEPPWIYNDTSHDEQYNSTLRATAGAIYGTVPQGRHKFKSNDGSIWMQVFSESEASSVGLPGYRGTMKAKLLNDSVIQVGVFVRLPAPPSGDGHFVPTNLRKAGFSTDTDPTIVGGDTALSDASDSTYVEIEDPGAAAYSSLMVDLTGALASADPITSIVITIRAEMIGATGHMYWELANDYWGVNDPYFASNDLFITDTSPTDYVITLNPVDLSSTDGSTFDAGTVQFVIYPNYNGDGARIYEIDVQVNQ